MKRDNIDNAIARELKEMSPNPPENEWFTPRLLNRLPQRQDRHIKQWLVLICVVVFVGVTLCWALVISRANFMVVTVRNLLTFVAMIIVTATVVWQTIKLSFD